MKPNARPPRGPPVPTLRAGEAGGGKIFEHPGAEQETTDTGQIVSGLSNIQKPGNRLLSTLLRRGMIVRMTGGPNVTQHLGDLARLRRVRDRIDREYDRPLDIEALARGAHMSAGHLSREFRRAYGESPYSYLMTRRIERAMALLRRGDLSVTEVCFSVGCSSLGTFSTRFTELVGVPPSVYRREAARATAGMPSCVAKQVTRPIRNREVRPRGRT